MAPRSPPRRRRALSFTVRITAIVRFAQDVNAIIPIAAKQDVSYEGQQNLYLTPAFLQRLAAGLGIPVQQLPAINLVAVRLRHGAADWKAFAKAAAAVGGGQISPSPGNINGIQTAASSAGRGIHLEVVALLLFGALAALVTVLLVGQAISRQVMLQGDDYATLRNLGTTRSQLVGIVLSRVAVIGVAGGALAFVVAVLASPLLPIGLARQAEIHPGFAVNLAILVPGFFAIAVLIVSWSVVPAWQVSRRSVISEGDHTRVAHPSRVADALAQTSLPPAAVMGVRFGLERGRGRSAVPVATAMMSVVLAVIAVTAALTFSTSLGHLVHSPRQQGWNWDVLVGNPNDQTDREAQAATLLAHNRLVGSYSAIAILAGPSAGTMALDGVTVDSALAFDPLKGSVYPPLLAGRPPRANNEIVLATQTLHQLHKRIGQVVHVQTPTGPLALRIVGRMIAPSVGDILTNGLGDGAWIYGPVVRQIQAQTHANPNGPPPSAFVLFAVRYAPGASPKAAFASLRRDFGHTVLRQLPAQDAVNLQSVDQLPMVFAGLVVAPRHRHTRQHPHHLHPSPAQRPRGPEDSRVHTPPNHRPRRFASDRIHPRRCRNRTPPRDSSRATPLGPRRLQHQLRVPNPYPGARRRRDRPSRAVHRTCSSRQVPPGPQPGQHPRSSCEASKRISPVYAPCHALSRADDNARHTGRSRARHRAQNACTANVHPSTRRQGAHSSTTGRRSVIRTSLTDSSPSQSGTSYVRSVQSSIARAGPVEARAATPSPPRRGVARAAAVKTPSCRSRAHGPRT